MTDQPQERPEDEDEEQQAEELLSSIRQSKPRREVLLAEKTRHVDLDPNDPAMMHPTSRRKTTVSHSVVRHRSPDGIAIHLVESWAPVELVPVTTLAERDYTDLLGWFVKNRHVIPRRVREQIYVMRNPTPEEAEQLEVFLDDPVIHVGRWVYDGNDSLLFIQRNVLRREGLLIYERDLEFELFFPPAFAGIPPMGTTA